MYDQTVCLKSVRGGLHRFIHPIHSHRVMRKEKHRGVGRKPGQNNHESFLASTARLDSITLEHCGILLGTLTSKQIA